MTKESRRTGAVGASVALIVGIAGWCIVAAFLGITAHAVKEAFEFGWEIIPSL